MIWWLNKTLTLAHGHLNVLFKWQGLTLSFCLETNTEPRFWFRTPQFTARHPEHSYTSPFDTDEFLAIDSRLYIQTPIWINPYFAAKEAQAAKPILLIGTLLFLTAKSSLGGKEIVVQAPSKNCSFPHPTSQALIRCQKMKRKPLQKPASVSLIFFMPSNWSLNLQADFPPRFQSIPAGKEQQTAQQLTARATPQWDHPSPSHLLCLPCSGYACLARRACPE